MLPVNDEPIAFWLTDEGPDSDIILTTRIRLARNLTGHRFCPRAKPHELTAIREAVNRGVEAIRTDASQPLFSTLSWRSMDELAEAERRCLIEQRVISREIATDSAGRGVWFDEAAGISVMVNEEDHVRAQTLAAGCQLDDVWRRAKLLDDALQQRLPFAYDDQLGFLTACPTNVGTGMLILPQRNPVITAKAVATLDHLSGGRVVLGVGAGWLAEEFAALNVPFDDRGKRLDEYIAVMRALWSGDKASFDGDYFHFTDCISRPRPVNGSVPIVIGGHTAAAARRAGRLGDAFFPMSASSDALGGIISTMRAAASEAGRDPGTIEVYTGAMERPGDALYSAVERLAELGVSQAVLPAYSPDKLAAIGQDLVSRFC
jgi:probable F420-dependent oxidoreductase